MFLVGFMSDCFLASLAHNYHKTITCPFIFYVLLFLYLWTDSPFQVFMLS